LESTRLEAFNQERRLLFGIAYRMTGSVVDSEDLLQEAFLRWQNAPDEEITSPQAYLSTIVTRLAIDYLRSAKVRREVYIGPWLPEPLLTSEALSPLDSYEHQESISTAFLVLLESLSPVERAVFLLREVFDYEYREIAAIVNKSEANCRQLFKRARQRVTERQARYEVSEEEQQELAVQFATACTTGDLHGLINLLAEDIVIYTDGGGVVQAARNPIHGPDKVARFLLGIINKTPEEFTVRFTSLNGQAGLIAYLEGHPLTTITLDIQGGRLQNVYVVANPDKLVALPDEPPGEPALSIQVNS
jgi:RNA polymerase sigma-70 factor (ECF subfamily)